MFSATFDDYDAYADTIDRVQARFIMQKLEHRFWRIDGTVLPNGTVLQHCLSGSGAIAQGVGHSSGVELAIPASGDFVANGNTVPLADALWLSPAREFLVSIPGIHRWFNVLVPESQANSIRLLEQLDDGRRKSGGAILGNRSTNRNVVSRLLMRFFSNLAAMPEIAVSKASLELFQAELLAALEAAYGFPPDPSHKRCGRTPLVDRESILRAVDAIEASAEPAIPVPQLADIAQVCDRSLRSGFRKYLGLSPTQYMQLRNLNRAWQRLSNSCPGDTTVAGVAADLGIWDFGRFAGRYQRLFGERPSETLQRA